jgi:polysaccharide chain length determinant protein (PEP-CTERM system associated)
VQDGSRHVEQSLAHAGQTPARKSGVDATYQKFSLYYLLEILFRRKRTIILPVIVATGLAAVGAALTPKSYKSSTSILLGKGEVLNPLVKWQTAVSLGVTDYLISFNKIIYSRSLLEELVSRLDLVEGDADPFAIEKMLGKLRGAISANAAGADSFGIDVTWKDPVQAKEITQTVTELFIEKSLEGGRKEATSAVDFIQKQLDAYQADLSHAENRLKKYREENPDRLPARHLAYLSDLTSYKKLLTEADVDIKELGLRVGLLEDRLSGETPMVVDSASFLNVSPIQQRLEHLRIEVQEMKVRMKPDHPELLRRQADLEAIARIREDEKKDNVATETKEVRSPMYQEVLARLQDAHVDLEAAVLKREEYALLITDLEQKVELIPQAEMALNSIEREVAINQELFETLRTKVEHARVNQQVELQSQENRFQILDAAEVPLRPAAPNVPLIIIGGFIGGLFMGLGLIFAFEFLDQSIVREEEMVFVFDETILATIPKMHS